MAMINCPECGKEISDKAFKCPHCGHFTENNEEHLETTTSQSILEVNNDFVKNIKTISSELPEEKPQNNIPNKKKKIILGVIIGITFLILSTIGIFITIRNSKIRTQQKEEIAQTESYNTYIDNLNMLYSATLSGASTAESVCVLTANVWQDAIYGNPSEETKKYVSGTSDFNEALNNLYADTEVQDKLFDLQEKQKDVEKYLQELQTCPSELSKAYDCALSTAVAFNALADLALEPQGNYNSYTTDEKNKVNTFMTEYTTLESVIPPKKAIPSYDKRGKVVTDDFSFDIYLNQMANKLPETVDSTGADYLGIYTDTVNIYSTEAECSYHVSNNLIYSINIDIENTNETLKNGILDLLRQKYGEENSAEDDIYSWNENSECMILFKTSEDKISINWLSAI